MVSSQESWDRMVKGNNTCSELSNCPELSVDNMSISPQVEKDMPVTAYGDGGLIDQGENEDDHEDYENHEEKENVEKKVQKKKTRGTRGGRKNREKREIRESRKKEKLGIEQLSPIKKELLRSATTSDEQEKNMNTKKTYTPKMLIKIRELYSTRVRHNANFEL